MGVRGIGRSWRRLWGWECRSGLEASVGDIGVDRGRGRRSGLRSLVGVVVVCSGFKSLVGVGVVGRGWECRWGWGPTLEFPSRLKCSGRGHGMWLGRE